MLDLSFHLLPNPRRPILLLEYAVSFQSSFAMAISYHFLCLNDFVYNPFCYYYSLSVFVQSYNLCLIPWTTLLPHPPFDVVFLLSVSISNTLFYYYIQWLLLLYCCKYSIYVSYLLLYATILYLISYRPSTLTFLLNIKPNSTLSLMHSIKIL